SCGRQAPGALGVLQDRRGARRRPRAPRKAAEQTMIVAALQTTIVWEDPQANFQRLRPKLAEAAAVGARMIVLPEMFSYGFSMNTAAIAEPFDGPSATFLAEQARDLGVWICGSLPEHPSGDAERPANTLVLAGPN